jgi:hypothetical protein
MRKHLDADIEIHEFGIRNGEGRGLGESITYDTPRLLVQWWTHPSKTKALSY